MALNLEQIMCQTRAIFVKYAGKDGNADSLSKSELTALALEQFPTLCNSGKKDEILKQVFGKMDMDGDDKVDFKEFNIFMCCLSMCLAGK